MVGKQSAVSPSRDGSDGMQTSKSEGVIKPNDLGNYRSDHQGPTVSGIMSGLVVALCAPWQCGSVAIEGYKVPSPRCVHLPMCWCVQASHLSLAGQHMYQMYQQEHFKSYSKQVSILKLRNILERA